MKKYEAIEYHRNSAFSSDWKKARTITVYARNMVSAQNKLAKKMPHPKCPDYFMVGELKEVSE